MWVRRAEVSDLPQVAAMFDAYRQFYEQPADLPLAQRFIDDRLRRRDSVILVGGEDDRLAGFCQLYPSFCSVLAKPIFTLYDLYVSPSARGQGFGRRLLSAAHDHAADEGYARLDLTTARNNQVAQTLYASEAWVLNEVFLTFTKTVVPNVQI